MKRLQVLLCIGVLLHSTLYAQEPRGGLTGEKQVKPSLFSALPDSFEVNQSEIQKIFAAEINEPISLQLSSQFVIEGKIVDKNQHNPGTLSVNIRLSNYHSALFNLSLRLLADNSTSIRGRILHPRYSDVLVLSKDKDKYLIKKSSQRLYMPE